MFIRTGDGGIRPNAPISLTINAAIRDGEGAARIRSARYAAHAVSLIGGAILIPLVLDPDHPYESARVDSNLLSSNPDRVTPGAPSASDGGVSRQYRCLRIAIGLRDPRSIFAVDNEREQRSEDQRQIQQDAEAVVSVLRESV